MSYAEVSLHVYLSTKDLGKLNNSQFFQKELNKAVMNEETLNKRLKFLISKNEQ